MFDHYKVPYPLVYNNINSAEFFSFTADLLRWNELKNDRSMPWKGEKDPYKIWLSEIILQQTRVEQGLSYYEKFVHHFPTITDLANADDEKVFKLWEGLGYYSRCKNLLATARIIAYEKQGVFPDKYKDIIQLKGIGPYTAAAIASFAFNEPHAVVDGNVQRVISRYFGINTPIDTTEGKKMYQQLADVLLDQENPAVYNQAIMDFGATVCKPQLPLCNECFLRNDCQALALNVVKSLPVKEKTLLKKQRFFHYFILQYEDGVYIHKRTDKDIWENLYEFILLESPVEYDLTQVKNQFAALIQHNVAEPLWSSKVFKQTLTHLTVYGQFHRYKINEPLKDLSAYECVSLDRLTVYPWPKLIQQFFQEKATLAQLF
ncbi:A/G-specific adenine glycosylase [Gynurincola endophyticus]|uniref:A/G-specific adenine glycosylase n=1 Tax=Gynurincola endophyticus TaxID=2479004 RepID=UPI001F2ABE01|nr:A/G-specific adenine glycosylase [Gynurincola endophyticus]